MIFLDTNIVLRLIDTGAPEHHHVLAAVEKLEANGEQLVLSLQVLCETWVVGTRPHDVNGLGWTIGSALMVIDALRGRFPVLGEDSTTPQHWSDVVSKHAVSGKRAHDARIVAVMLTHGVSRILTLNESDFASLPVQVVTPKSLVG